VAENGRKAIEALRENSYDLVFMDCQMPEIDGFEATRIVRSENSGIRNPRVPIIAMTANAMKGARQECIEAGMDDYLAKPITPDAVARKIQKWLPL
jgi:CheY-like chemotaxis protein